MQAVARKPVLQADVDLADAKGVQSASAPAPAAGRRGFAQAQACGAEDPPTFVPGTVR